MNLVPAWAVLSLVVVTALAANMPFMNQRIWLVGPKRTPKTATWHLLELCLNAALVFALGRWLEGHVSQVAPLRWEFFVIWACVFLTFAFPGFTWRYLRKAGP